MRNYSRNFWISLAVLGLVFASAGIASAIQITMVDGDWVNPSPAVPVVTINNSGPTGGTSTIKWGVLPPPQYPQDGSSYNFISMETPFDALTNGTPFALGDFVHNNFVIKDIRESILTKVSLDVNFEIAYQVPVHATFDFTHNETPNLNLPNGVNDIVTLVQPQTDAVDFWVSNHHYIFTLIGFLQNGQQPNVFSTEEGKVNIATLYGQIIERPVPEPGTMLLLGIGLAGMGFVARRRKK